MHALKGKGSPNPTIFGTLGIHENWKEQISSDLARPDLCRREQALPARGAEVFMDHLGRELGGHHSARVFQPPDRTEKRVLLHPR